jgi:hypothetical protein
MRARLSARTTAAHNRDHAADDTSPRHRPSQRSSWPYLQFSASENENIAPLPIIFLSADAR